MISKTGQSSLKLKNELRRLRRQLFENRGEWPGCYACPLQLVCFMKRDPRRARWCGDCDGWSLRDERLIVKCQGFRVKEFVDHQRTVMGRCPNCNRLEPEFETYRVIEGRLMELHEREKDTVYTKRMKKAMYGDRYEMKSAGGVRAGGVSTGKHKGGG